jgi:glycerophosphoryl diester phosphodiesterase
MTTLLVTVVVPLMALPSNVAPGRPGPWQARGYVAHAFGAPPDGSTYTNSLEAFEESYDKGFRTFEVDLVRLHDGRVLAAHDLAERRYGLPKGTRFGDVTADQMRGRRFDGWWTTLIDGDLIRLLQKHPDATLILDTKGPIRQQIAIARRLARLAPPSVRARMYPHVHTQFQLDSLRRLHAFADYVLALYLWRPSRLPEAPAFLERNGLHTVMIHSLLYTDELRVKFIRAGARWIFVHAIASHEEIMSWRARGIGVYSDGWIMAL